MGAVAEKIHAPQSKSDSTLDKNDPIRNDQIRSLVELVQNKPLPIFKHTLDRLKKFDGKANVSISKIIEILHLDPGYSHKIFVNANLGLVKSKRDPCSSLNHAILVLGVPNVIDIGQKLPVITDLENPQARSRIFQIVSRSYHAGTQAREWMFDHGKSSAEIAFITAQMSNVYLASLWFHAPEKMTALFKTTSQQELFDQNGILTQIGQNLSKYWKFSDLLQESLDQNSNSSRLVQIVRFSNKIAHLADNGWYTKQMANLITESSSILDYQEDQLIQFSHRNSVIAARETTSYPVKAAACRLLELDSPKTVKKEKTPPKKSPATVEKIVKKKPTSATASNLATKVGKAKKTIPKIQLQLQELAKLGKNKSSSRKILEFSFTALSEVAGENRVAFFLLDQNKTTLRSRFVTNFPDQENTISLPLNQKNIFVSLIQKSNSIFIHSKNRSKYKSLLPAGLSLNIQNKDFMSMSLFINNKPIGLFYLESAKKPLTTQLYKHFVTVCKTTKIALEEVKNHAK